MQRLSICLQFINKSKKDNTSKGSDAFRYFEVSNLTTDKIIVLVFDSYN